MSERRACTADRVVSPKSGANDNLPGGSSNRIQRKVTCGSARYWVPSSPELVRNMANNQGNASPYNLNDISVYNQEDYQQGNFLEGFTDQEEKVPQHCVGMHSFPLDDLPQDLLDDYVEPSLYEHDSFDDVMCAFASPQPRPREISPLVGVSKDALSVEEQRQDRNLEKEPPLCSYVIEPLPDDPNIIPPHPTNPNDFAAMIRRARAIERLKAMQEAAILLKTNSQVTEKVRVPKQKVFTTIRRPVRLTRSSTKPPLKGSRSNPSIPEVPKSKQIKTKTAAQEHQPDYIQPKHAADIHGRKLAGLKSKNPKLLLNPIEPSTYLPSSRFIKPSPSTDAASMTATYEDIIKRAARILSKSNATKGIPCSQICHREDEEDLLDEFETLEELYNAQPMEKCASITRQDNQLIERIKALERQIYEASPCKDETRHSSGLPVMEQQGQKEMPAEGSQMFGITDAPAECVSSRSPARYATPKTTLKDLDVMERADLDYANSELVLSDISIPTEMYDQDISLQEYGLEDITSPELVDLSISLPKALDPDYPLTLADEITMADTEGGEQEKSLGFLDSVASAVVDKLKNIFVGLPREEHEKNDDGISFQMDSSLPNIFEDTPPQPKAECSPENSPSEEALSKSACLVSPIVIPPHPKDPKDYATMIKRAQLIQKLKAREMETALSHIKSKRTVFKPSVPKTGSVAKKRAGNKIAKSESTQKVYPPGEFPPGYVEAVARARALAGYKNRSIILNPQRAATIAALNSKREAELAAEAALPTVERIRRRIARIRENNARPILTRPSIETLATLAAIRENLVQPSQSLREKSKRTSLPRRMKQIGESVFTKQLKRPIGRYKPMTPITEESYGEKDLIEFSPLRPHELRMRLNYLTELANKTKEAQCKECPTTPKQIGSPAMPRSAEYHYTPITLRSPTGSSTPVEVRKETFTQKFGNKGLEETIHEEIMKTSQIEDNGQVSSKSRKVTTTTDEHGNVVLCQVEEEGHPQTEGDAIILDDIEAIEAPDFLNTSVITSEPEDPSLPTPRELIDRIRQQVHQKLQHVMPPVLTVPPVLGFQHDFPDENLFDVAMPEVPTSPEMHTSLSLTSLNIHSPTVSLPFCLGETPPHTKQPVSPSQQASAAKMVHPRSAEVVRCSKIQSDFNTKSTIVPSYPKDYVAMVKRARAIHNLKKQKGAGTAALSHARPINQAAKKIKRTTLSRRPGLVPRVQKRSQKELKLKECQAQPPPIPPEYAADVARARQLAGLKNTTALLNPELAAKMTAQKAAEDAFELLPPYQKILKRMEKLRAIHTNRSKVEVSADVLGVIEAIRDTVPPIRIEKKISTAKSQHSEKPQEKVSPKIRDGSLEEFEAIERELAKTHHSPQIPFDTTDRERLSLDEFENLERQIGRALQHQKDMSRTKTSLEEFEEIEKLLKATEESTTGITITAQPRTSLDEFEKIERQLAIAEFCPEQGTVPIHLYDVTPRATNGARRRRNLMQEMATNQPVENADLYKNLVSEFAIGQTESIESNGLHTLMSYTPECPKERLRKIKEAQQTHIAQKEDLNVETCPSPLPVYTPITLASPTKSSVLKELTLATQADVAKDDKLVDLQTPKLQTKGFKLLDELRYIPFDVLEYEDVPHMPDISFDDPISPPPQPSELINKIRMQVQKKLKEDIPAHKVFSPKKLNFPDVESAENLFELSAPSLIQTPQMITPKSQIQQTPSVSLPFIWQEFSPHTSEVKALRSPSPVISREPPPFESSKVSPAEAPFKVPPHPKDPKDYEAMIKRAQAIHKLKLQQRETEKETAAPVAFGVSTAAKSQGRVPISRWAKPPQRVSQMKPSKKLVQKKTSIKKWPSQQKTQVIDETDCSQEPPPIPTEYAAAVARARTLAGYKNKTAALNPDVAARQAKRKAAAEAQADAFAALSEHEKLKIRLQKLKSRPEDIQLAKLTIEQMAILQHLKEVLSHESSSHTTSRAQRLSITPCTTHSAESESFSNEMAEFEELEKIELSPHSMQQDAPKAPDVLEMSQIIAKLQQQQLATPALIRIEDKYKHLTSQMRTGPKIPTPLSPIKTPDFHYSPIPWESPMSGKRIEKSTMHSSPHSEKRTTDTTTNIATQTPKTIQAQPKDTARDYTVLEDIEEPSLLDMSPISPTGAPRPRDIIEQITKNVHNRPSRRDVPVDHLIELRTPPRELPLPQDISVDEDLLAMTCPTPPITPPLKTPDQFPGKMASDISLPEVFVESPNTSVPLLRRPMSSLEGPISSTQSADSEQQLNAYQKAEETAKADATTPKRGATDESTRAKGLPISKRYGMRPRPVLKKQSETGKTARPEWPAKPQPLPAEYVEQVVRARRLAGLPYGTKALTPNDVAKTIQQPPPPSTSNFRTLMARIAEMRRKGHMPQAKPTLAAAGYLDAIKAGFPGESNEGFSGSPLSGYISNAPITLDSSPHQQIASIHNFEDLLELESLGNIEEPSLVDLSAPEQDFEQSMFETPKNSFSTPSRLIDRIRKQVFEKLKTEKVAALPSPNRSTPPVLNFPEDFPDDEIFDISAPDFTESPQRSDSNICSPNISLPQYFNMLSTPKSASPGKCRSPKAHIPVNKTTISPPIMGVHRGIRIKTPQESNVRIPPHPKDPADYIAMIQRAQLVQKLKALREAEAMQSKTKISSRSQPTTRNVKNLSQREPRGKSMSKTAAKHKVPAMQEYPAEPPSLPLDYVLAVARARKIAGLKNTAAVLNPPKPPQDYATIRARAAALRSQIGDIGLAEQEFGDKMVYRKPCEPKNQETKEQDVVWSTNLKPARDRYRDLRSTIHITTPKTSHKPATPDTPDILHEYSPIELVASPRCPFVDNISLPQLGDVSMPADLYDNYPYLSDNDIEQNLLSYELQLPRQGPKDDFDALENQIKKKFNTRQISLSPRAICSLRDDSMDEFEALERSLERTPQTRQLSISSEVASALVDNSIQEFETPERNTQQTLEKPSDNMNRARRISLTPRAFCVIQKDSMDEFEALERNLEKTPQARQLSISPQIVTAFADNSIQEFETPERNAQQALEKPSDNMNRARQISLTPRAFCVMREDSMDEFDALERYVEKTPQTRQLSISPRLASALENNSISEFATLERNASQTRTCPRFNDTPQSKFVSGEFSAVQSLRGTEREGSIPNRH
ncbi:uncharacterized protein LOC106085585 [Stomoxys calcitrans]|uniref:uncharacterized protein LOC106085585 n=1 Tax=Stomoxys calcitrans TaxID=35570 RepID=UPI0027E2F4B1|nr:uncharacterized protein LOC106085585 [Stomoxys calcitrans]